MTASERLRALDASIGEPSNCDWGWDDDEIGPLRNALPLIADVVEAAEEVSRWPAVGQAQRRLRDPLTALRDALEERR